MGSSTVVLECKNITKTYIEPSGNKLVVLENSCFSIKKGELVSFIGPSGSGKSTLLQICGLLDKPDSGEVIINGVPTSQLNDKERTKIRRLNLGFVYQAHHLFTDFTSLENVMMPLLIQNLSRDKAYILAKKQLEEMGLGDKIDVKPYALSGGEKQRVAIARAIIAKPDLILADEPTGNLDKDNGIKILNILSLLVKRYNLSLLMVTHNQDLCDSFDRKITINNRKITEILM